MSLLKDGDMIMRVIIGANLQEYGLDQFGGTYICRGREICRQLPKYWRLHGFTTDSILNLEERTGRKGTFINVYRYIMYYYSHIPQQVLDEYNKNTETQQDDLFRIVMKLNTAKVMVVDPALYLGGEKEYVRSLFMDSGVRV